MIAYEMVTHQMPSNEQLNFDSNVNFPPVYIPFLMVFPYSVVLSDHKSFHILFIYICTIFILQILKFIKRQGFIPCIIAHSRTSWCWTFKFRYFWFLYTFFYSNIPLYLILISAVERLFIETCTAYQSMQNHIINTLYSKLKKCSQKFKYSTCKWNIKIKFS